MTRKLSETYNICVFAYNEEKNIKTSLEAIQANISRNLHKCFLIANGCTDKTVAIAEDLRRVKEFKQLHIIELKLGDKCNAWNYYVHNLADKVGCHFMIDADVEFSDQCFQQLFEALQGAADTVNVIAGMPLTGRNLGFYESLVKERSCFFGNLYGMSPRFFSSIIRKQFYLPIGLNWIDSFLTKAANTDIEFGRKNLPNRVHFVNEVGFKFESLSPFSWGDIKLYKNRIARYELGKIQEEFLDNIHVSNWPKDMREINIQISRNIDKLTKDLSIIKKLLIKDRLRRLRDH